MKNTELIAVNQDSAGIQGTLRLTMPYANGDTRGAAPSAAAAAILAAAATITDSGGSLGGNESSPASEGPFYTGVTYCEFAPHIADAQQWVLAERSAAHDRDDRRAVTVPKSCHPYT